MEIWNFAYMKQIQSTCGCCKNKFFRTLEHVYKVKENGKFKYFCSYGCKRKYEKEHSTKKANRIM